MTIKHFWLSLSLAFASLSNAQWVDIGGPDSASSLVTGDIIWGGDAGGHATMAARPGGVFFRMHGVFDWSKNSPWPRDTNMTAVIASRYFIFAGTRDSGVYRTGTPHASSWTEVNAGLTNRRVAAFAAIDSHVYVGTEGGGVFRTTNSGAAWTAASGGLTDTNIRVLWVSGGLLVAGGNTGGVFVSGDRGTSWSSASVGLPTGRAVRALTGLGGALFASVTGGGVYRSLNSGASWVPSGTGLPDTVVRSFAVAGGALFAGTNQGVFFSRDTGASWESANTGLTSLVVFGLSIEYQNIFAGTADGVWYRPLSQITTSIARRADLDHSSIRLESTRRVMIRTTRATRVVVNAYGADGRFAATVLDETFPAGSFSRPLATSGLPHGVYFYRLRAGDVRETRRVVLAD